MSLVIVVFSFANGCTYNISMAHTEGVASDVIDDTQSPTNSADIKVPFIEK